MKPYQHRDPLADQGKAEPKPKQTTQTSGKIHWLPVHPAHRNEFYAKRPRTRMDGTQAMIRIDCCRGGHA